MWIFVSGLVVAIVLGVVAVLVIDKHVANKKQQRYASMFLWLVTIGLSYALGTSIYEPIKFEQIKRKRYAQVIQRMKDIRAAQLAYKQAFGYYQSDFDSLVSFVETGQLTITQQRDTIVIDKELTKAYGVDHHKEIAVIDTIGYTKVKDFVFKGSNRYKHMMFLPIEGNSDKLFEMETGFINTESGARIPVFQVTIDKNIILYDQEKHLIEEENQVLSVEEINGTTIRLGSMSDVSTNGNWPKTYEKKEQ